MQAGGKRCQGAEKVSGTVNKEVLNRFLTPFPPDTLSAVTPFPPPRGQALGGSPFDEPGSPG